MTELLQYIADPTDLMRAEAEALLAGIVLDTKNFSMRTGGRTFEAAAFLRRAGADTAEVKRLFQNDLEGTIAKYSIIQNAKMYREGIAVAVVDHTVGRITAAQAADELLNIIGIDTSFVLYPDGDRVIVSARSIGEVNVQVILEKLGGRQCRRSRRTDPGQILDPGCSGAGPGHRPVSGGRMMPGCCSGRMPQVSAAGIRSGLNEIEMSRFYF